METEKPTAAASFEERLAESKKITALIGIPDTTIIDIYRAPSDWEFILKIDALLEAAARVVVKANLVGGPRMDQDKVEAFIDTLPMRGRTSLLSLLDAAGCPNNFRDLIDSVRQLRNGFAHDIVQVGMPLIEVIQARKDRTSLLKKVSWVEKFEEPRLVEMYRADHGFLRFSIVSGVISFLAIAYHGAIKSEPDPDSGEKSLDAETVA
jgi:hypothetical protein